MGSSTSRSRARRPPLDRATIVAAALRLAQRREPGGMSFRALGRELGADPTAVYRHFRDRNELVEAALDQLLATVVDTVPTDLPWRERLRAAADAYLEVVISHPVIGAEAGHRTTGGPGELAMLEVLLSALVDAGLSREQTVRYYPLVAGYAASMAASQAAYLLHDARVPVASERAWVGTQGLLDADRYPTAAALREEVAVLRDADVFHSGFELLLDAIEASASRTA